MKRLRLASALLLALLQACSKTSERPAVSASASIKSTRWAIVGGSLDTNSAHEAVAFIEMYSGGQVDGFCTGTLISPNVVLTAGHCVSDQYGNFNGTASSYGVFFDTNNDGTPDYPRTPCWLTSSCTTPKNVSQVVRHPSYDDNWGNQGAPVNDIAYLKLTAAPAGITPIPYLTAALATGNLQSGATVEFAGYGLQDYPGINCNDYDCPSGTRFHVSDTLDSVCTSSAGCSGTPPGTLSYTGAKGPCSGDSGGPAFLTVSGQQYVAGVTSYGDQYCKTDGVSTDVAYFDGWLAGVVGTLAANGAACTSAAACQSGVCVSGVCCNQACSGACQACTVASGASKDGTCSALTGTSCSDGNACTENDACQAGTCTGTAKVCPGTAGPCTNAGACNASTGACTGGGNKPDGTSCSDGNGCTTGDTCQAGVCTGGAAINTCPAPSACKGPSACNAATGACEAFPNLPDGTSCDDGNPCTIGDSCASGACVPGAAKACPAPEACHGAGACNASTGQCTYGTLPNGTSCDDHNACTTGDHCASGACQGTATANACAADECHAAGTCDPGTGICSGSNMPDGTACDDHDASTVDDQCASGLCKGTPKGADPCYGKANGTSCSDGNACTLSDLCMAQTCTGTNPKTCPAADQCHQAGACDWQTGECAYASKANGTACDDGDSATVNDVCRFGKCAGESSGDQPDAGESTVQQPSGCASVGGGAQSPALLLVLGAMALRRRNSR